MLKATKRLKVFTCVPHILHPHVGTGSEEQPLHWDEEEANDVRGKRHTHKEHWEGLLGGEDRVTTINNINDGKSLGLTD